MRRNALLFIAFMLLACLSYLAGFRHEPGGGNVPETGTRQVLYYLDPLHPEIRFHKPGLAPSGEKLKPVYAGRGGRQHSVGTMRVPGD